MTRIKTDSSTAHRAPHTAPYTRYARLAWTVLGAAGCALVIAGCSNKGDTAAAQNPNNTVIQPEAGANANGAAADNTAANPNKAVLGPAKPGDTSR